MPFIREKCTACGDCFTRCQYLQLKKEQAVKEIKNLMDGRDSPVLRDCATCYACNEYCPTGANPFDLIAEHQGETHALGLSDGALAMLEKQYEPYTSDKQVELKGPLLSQCAFLKTNAPFFEGQLFKGLTLVGGRNFFCNLVYLHTGQISLSKKRAQTIVDNVAKFGAKEVICFHDECYLLYAKYAPAFGVKVPFRPVHIFEYLVKYLKTHPKAVHSLNLKVAYQRSCSSRLTPEKDHYLDELFAVLGVERVKRTYDYANALCCQAPATQISGAADPTKIPRDMILKKKKAGKERQGQNIQDAVQAGATAMVFVCPMCHETLKGICEKNNLRPIFITELCRMALGEI